jgi:hypothetical protein
MNSQASLSFVIDVFFFLFVFVVIFVAQYLMYYFIVVCFVLLLFENDAIVYLYIFLSFFWVNKE